MPTTPRDVAVPRGFSLIELVIVVVIIGIIGAIAIPRLSRGSDGASASAAKHDLIVLNKALDRYAAEHGGKYPAPSRVADQLLKYTDYEGNVSDEKTQTHIYGPYLRKIPPAPAGEAPGSTVLSALDTGDVGWLYFRAAGRIYINRTHPIDLDAEDDLLNNLNGGVQNLR